MSHNAYSLSLALCHHFPSTLSLALCDHASSVSPTLHQSPSPFSISHHCQYPGALPYPFRTLTIPTAIDYRYVALPLLFCAAFVLWEMDVYHKGISHYQNLQFFSFVLWV